MDAQWFVLASLFPLLLCSCNRSTSGSADATLPTISVDAAHAHIDNPKPMSYEVPPADGLIVDTSGFTFKTPGTLTHHEQPNVINIVIEKEIYEAPFVPGRTTYRLDAGSLKSVRSTQSFGGLKAGSEILLAIGFRDK